MTNQTYLTFNRTIFPYPQLRHLFQQSPNFSLFFLFSDVKRQHNSGTVANYVIVQALYVSITVTVRCCEADVNVDMLVDTRV